MRFEKEWKVNEVERYSQAVPDGRIWQKRPVQVSRRNENGETGRNEVQQRESIRKPDDDQFWIISQSGWGAIRGERWKAVCLDTDGWQSAKGSEQKIWGYQERSNHVQNDDIKLNDWYRIPWIKRMFQKGRGRKNYSSSVMTKTFKWIVELDWDYT